MFHSLYTKGDEMKTPVIYKIRNVVNQKFYVGSTGNTRERFRCHRNRLRKNKHHCQHLQAAWNNYGEECFIFEVIEHVESIDRLQAAENVWLAEWVGKPICYNKSKYSESPMRGIAKEDHPSYGRVKSEEEKQAIANTLKEGYASGEYPHPRLGKIHSEETRLKIVEARAASDKNKGENHYRYGKTVSEETRKKIGDTQRGVKKEPRVYTPEGLEKARENMKRNAVKQDPKPFSDVLAKFPQEIKDRYDFSNALYTGALNRIERCVCRAHGVFSQYAAQFRKGRGCPSCGAVERGESKRKQMKEFWASGEGHQVFRKPK
jgi:group I intron endonuclease